MKIQISLSAGISDAKEIVAQYMQDAKVARIVEEGAKKLAVTFKKHGVSSDWYADERGRKRSAIETILRGFYAKLLGAGVSNQRNAAGNKPVEVLQHEIEVRAALLGK